MDVHGWLAVATLVVAATLFVTKWLPLGVTALAIPVVLVVTGVIHDPRDALVGFGNHAVIAIGSVFVVGGALQESGVASLLGRGLYRLVGRSETGLVVLIMLATGALSAFMNNAAAVALLLPAAVSLSRRAMIPPSRVLMPLGFAAVLGGTVTVIGTAPNLLIADYLEANVGHPIGVFEFALVGVPILLTGILYMVTIGRRLLPYRSEEDRLREALVPEEVAQSYGISQNLFQMRVVPASGIAGKSLREAAIRTRYGLSVVMVVRPGKMGTQRYLEPSLDLVFEPEDRLYMEGEDVAAWNLAEAETLQFGLAGPQAIERMLGRGMTIAEVTIPPRSNVVGRSLREMGMRKRLKLNVLSLWRRGRPVRENAGGVPIEVGDAFLISGPVQRVLDLKKNPDFIVLTDQSTVEDVGRAPLAAALMLVAVLPPIFGWVPLSISALAAALAMVATGCISFDGLRRAVDFKVLALIVGTIPLGAALQEQHVADAAATGILHLSAPLGAAAVLTALFLLAALMAMLSTNAAAAVIVAPVAGQAALAAQISPNVALLAVGYGCSCAFMLPFAQCNLLVMGPGAYRARDFLWVGLGLSVVMAVTTVACLSFL
jgi:di/tricarboxylate transporter